MTDRASPAAAGAASPSDGELLDEILEIAADRCEDITPLVYARFFERRPEASALFRDDDETVHGRGRMLVEIMTMLIDSAGGKPYFRSAVTAMGADHVGYGVRDRDLYRDFMGALSEVLARLLGADWTPMRAAAWERQEQALMAALPKGLGSQASLSA